MLKIKLFVRKTNRFIHNNHTTGFYVLLLILSGCRRDDGASLRRNAQILLHDAEQLPRPTQALSQFARQKATGNHKGTRSHFLWTTGTLCAVFV